MFGLIRAVIIIAFVLVASVVVLKGFCLKSSKIGQYAFLLGIMMFSFVISIFPIENVFYTFDSPEKVYKYMSFKNTEIDTLVEGDKCDYIIGKTTNEKEFSVMVIPKTDSGYKIGIGLKTKTRTIVGGLPDGCMVLTIEYGEDLFAEISFLSPGTHEVTSNEDGTFTVRKFTTSEGEEFFEYYIHISDKENFKLYIDGTEIDVIR